jgi:hypothetical protein
MKAKRHLAMVTLVAGFAAASAAQADTINFSQFGPTFIVLSSPLTGVTVGGDTVTLTSPTGAFERFDQSNGWNGIFPVGDPVVQRPSPFLVGNGTNGDAARIHAMAGIGHRHWVLDCTAAQAVAAALRASGMGNIVTAASLRFDPGTLQSVATASRPRGRAQTFLLPFG